MKICFACDVHYSNYTKRIQESSLKSFLDFKLYEYDIHYYVSTNRPDDLSHLDGVNNVKIFDINELRKDNLKSIKYELLPINPVGIYPSKFPWNLRRFVIEQAALDGFDYIIYTDADMVFKQDITPEHFVEILKLRYEPNKVKSNVHIFEYSEDSTSEVFEKHSLYLKTLNFDFSKHSLNTIDGPAMVFMGETNKDIINLVNIWHKFTDYGYEKPNGFGYDNFFIANLSFVIPMSNFEVISCDFPFYSNHVFEDRYDSNYKPKPEELNEGIVDINDIFKTKSIDELDIFTPNTIEENDIFKPLNDNFTQPNVVNKLDDNDTITFYLEKYSCEKIASGYHNIYEKIFTPIKEKEMKILEIGVGTISLIPLENENSVAGSMYGWKEKNKDYNPGSSLRAFRDFFTNSEIYGVDKRPDCNIDELRIKTYIFNSIDKNKCDEYLIDRTLDIIIDDADHDPDYRIKTFTNFYPKLKEDGLYIIEGLININKLLSFFDSLDLNYKVFNDNLLVINFKSDVDYSIVNDTNIKNIPTNNSEPEVIKINKPNITFINTDGEFKINGLRFADKGFFINLPESQDRLHLVVEQIEKYNIEGLNRFNALTDELRQFSCTKSHLKVFENSLIDDYEVIFVAEDDFMIEDVCYNPKNNKTDFFRILNDVHEDLKNLEWDVLLFGCNPKGPLIPLTDNLALVNRSTGAWAYLIKKRAYRYLLKNSNYKKDYIAIDDWLPLLNDKGFITLTTIPLTINHGVNLVSTLQPSGLVNYDSWIKGSYHKHFYDIYTSQFLKNNNIEKDLTVVITGHFVENFNYYLEYLFHSLPDELKKCKILIHYDETCDGDVGFEKLKLEALFKDKITGLNTTISYSFGGLISSVKYVIDKIKTPYFLFLEHDWVFLKKDLINFNDVLNSFNNHDFINAVWFSKDDNVMRGFEICEDIDGSTTPFELESRVNECNLITTCRWSNNPAIFRLTKFKEWFDNIINNEHVDKINQGCHNVEETMIPYYRNQITTIGWDRVKDNWGTYLYGNLNEGPYVGHTDASRRYQGHNKSTPEINGENYIINNPIKEYENTI